MIDIVKFILFLVYTISVFFIDRYFLLLVVAMINLIFMIILRLRPKQVIRNLLNVMPFILFTVMINIILQDIKGAILVFFRLILVCNMTFIFSKVMTTTRLAMVVEKLLCPLKLFKIDPKDISIMICIAISFIPILKDELTQIRYSLKSKGFNTQFFYLLKNLNLIFKPFFVSLIRRIAEMEAALKAKAYIETK